MARLFISYRRNDASGHAGRLFDNLSPFFRAGAIYYDRESNEPGAPFRKEIEKALDSALAVVVVIGPDWASDEHLKRLHDEKDLVRGEIVHALDRKEKEDYTSLVILPVLVGGAMLPEEIKLPVSMRPLLGYDVFELNGRQEEYAFKISSLCKYLVQACRSSDDLVDSWGRWLKEKGKRVVADNLNLSGQNIKSRLNLYINRFLTKKDWEEGIRDQIERVMEDGKDFLLLSKCLHDLSQIDLSDDYETIAEKISSLIKPKLFAIIEERIQEIRNESGEDTPETSTLKKLKQAVDVLQNMVKLPKFEKCFLLIGDYGAGKSHFIYHLIEEGVENNVFYCPVDLTELHMSNGRLDQVILDQIYAASGFWRWDGLSDIDIFMRYHLPGSKVVIILDDLQKLLKVDPAYGKSLFNFVRSNNRLRTFHYIFSLQESDYDQLGRFEPLYRRYAFLPFSTEETNETERVDIGGWINLNKINLDNETGVKMLREKRRETQFGDLTHLDFTENRKRVVATLSHPLIASLMIALDLFNPADLVYIDLLNNYWEKRIAELDASTKVGRGEIEDTVFFLSRSLSKSGTFLSEYTWLLNQIQNEAKDSEIKDRSVAKLALATLAQFNLLRIIEATRALGEGYVSKKILLLFESFWELNMANRLLEDVQDAIPLLPLDEALAQLEVALAKIPSEHIKEEVYEFFFLLVDNALAENKQKKPNFRTALCKETFEMELLPKTSLLLAGPKTSSESTQRLIYNHAQHNLKNPDQRSLFALMYFLSGIRAKLSPLQVIKQLQQFIPDIHRYGLSSYYIFVVSKFLNSIRDNDELAECMQYLSGCEMFGSEFTSTVGKFAFEIMKRNCGETPEVLLSSLYLYLRKNDQQAKSEQRLGKPPEQIFYFRQWVLYPFCDHVINAMGIPAYHFLKKNTWYLPDINKICRHIAFEMEMQASLSFGHWYRRNKNNSKLRNEYCKLVEGLVSSSSTNTKRVGFYMMRNTRITSQDEDLKIDAEFRPYLETLYRDLQMANLVKERLDDFRANLDEAFLSKQVQRSKTKTRKAELRKARAERKRKRVQP